MDASTVYAIAIAAILVVALVVYRAVRVSNKQILEEQARRTPVVSDNDRSRGA